MDGAPFHLRDNRLLSLLDDATLQTLAPHLEPVRLHQGDAMYEPLRPMLHAWFPTDCVLSMLAANADGEMAVEVATIGSEGMVGVALYLGAELAHGLVFTQVDGGAFRMPADVFRAATRDRPALARVVLRYTHALMVQIAQGTACNRVHHIGQRCARWLLQTHDRVRGDTFDLTQEYLAHMLGERRAAVNAAASQLQSQGLIRYTRGRIQVTDRPGLEAAACSCYGVIRDQYVRMLAPVAP
ncbi:MAG TPA: Crp/Fnr family transcriptional regulator [Ramlibacter sp.]|uniref:Crp/Fnr family transcriptional regulator n=1 Tax=Ramlibacter sp. TaxID=1917967 RepID=UPI002ED47A65